MRTMIPVMAVAALGAAAGATAGPNAGAKPKKLFLDVHDVGPGKVTARAAAGAHALDLAAQKKHGVSFKAYWVDERAGKIYCLAEAPSADAINHVHEEAHGMLAAKAVEVTADNESWSPAPHAKLFFDTHHLGAGKVTSEAVAAAHVKDLAAQAKHGVRYLNYWFDAESGTVNCLVEAPSREAALAVHAEAHGLMPDNIEEVIEGR
ncbi:MAG TPA: DUF4242 domain-containing protein [Polyangia bacterium]|nr:DUF4242 domain-containing protein [Polyangia bacterium]